MWTEGSAAALQCSLSRQDRTDSETQLRQKWIEAEHSGEAAWTDGRLSSVQIISAWPTSRDRPQRLSS